MFSDAATEFSDSGISPANEEHLESITGSDKNVEKTVEADLDAGQLLKVEGIEGKHLMTLLIFLLLFLLLTYYYHSGLDPKIIVFIVLHNAIHFQSTFTEVDLRIHDAFHLCI